MPGDDEMALLDEKTKGQIRERFARTLTGPVELRLYRRPDSGRLVLPGGLGCSTCDTTEELARALTEAAPGNLRLTVIDVSQGAGRGGSRAQPDRGCAGRRGSDQFPGFADPL